MQVPTFGLRLVKQFEGVQNSEDLHIEYRLTSPSFSPTLAHRLRSGLVRFDDFGQVNAYIELR